MLRDRPPYVAQGTWRSGSLHVWGWNGIDSASMAWFYGFRALNRDGMRTGWHDSPDLVRRDRPARRSRHPTSRRCTSRRCSSTRSASPSGCRNSPTPSSCPTRSNGSPASANSPGERCRADASCPIIADEGPVHRRALGPRPERRRRPVGHRRPSNSSPPSMPPVCTLGSGADVNQIFDRLVDGIARGLLAQSGWRAELGKQRRPDLQALRATFGALSKPDYVIRGNTEGFDVAARPPPRRTRPSSPSRRRRTRRRAAAAAHRARRPAGAMGRAARTRRRQRLVPLVHRQRRVGSQRRRARRRPRRTHLDLLVDTVTDTGHAHRVHPRARRPRARTRADRGRTRTRRRRGLHRHRSRRAAAPRHRTDRARTARAHQGQRQR